MAINRRRYKFKKRTEIWRGGAARNAEVENHGSSSFALVKYQMPESHGQFFYALYMHLKKIDLKQELEDFLL
ncbi:MAG TPA: hypothetical protein DD629_00745 [Treponema sp.]|nr:hypothetical protein [Treponema sp.]